MIKLGKIRQLLVIPLGRLFSVFLLVNLGFSQSCYLDQNVGCRNTNSLHFLKLPVGARALSMGGKTVSTDVGGSAGYTNPANLALISDYWVAFSHNENYEKFRHEYLAALYPLQGAGAFGVGIGVFTKPDTDTDTNEPSYVDMAIGLSYGRTLFHEKLAIGMGLELLRSQVGDALALGYAFNSGINFQFTKDYRVSLAMHHLTHGIKYDTTSAKTQNPPKYSTIEFGKVLGFGRWSWNVGFTEAIGEDHLYHLGLEWKLFNPFFLRTGYENSLDNRDYENISGFAWGLGIDYAGLSIDFGTRYYHEDEMLALTVSYKHGGGVDFTEKELIARAHEKFKQGNYNEAEKLAKKILVKNPSHWTALALLSNIKKTRERLQGNSLSIIYTANSWGNILPIVINERSLGGMSRKKTKIQELRGRYPNALLLDAGGATLKGKDDPNESLVYRMVGKMNYHAVNIGMGSLLSYPDSIKEAAQAKRIRWVSSNVNHIDWGNSASSSINVTTTQGVHASVLGAVVPSLLSDSLLNKYGVLDVVTSLKQAVFKSKDSADVTILLLYGDMMSAKQIAQLLPEIDVIILGGENNGLEEPVLKGKTMIVCPGIKGTHVGVLNLTFNEEVIIESFSNELISLDKSVEKSKAIEGMYSIKNQVVKAGRSHLAYKKTYANQFPFVHKKNNANELALFVKDTRTNFNYNIGLKEKSCSAPKLGITKDKVLYLCGPEANKSLFVQGVASKYPIKISKEQDKIGYYEWGPLNHWVYYTNIVQNKSDIYKMTLTGSQVTQVTKGEFGDLNNFNLQPEGNKIALEANKHGRSQVWIVDKNMETPMRISTGTENAYKPKWSKVPDYLAFLVENPTDATRLRLEVFVFSKNKRILISENIKNTNYSWSPDGKSLYYSSGINVMDINKFNIETEMQTKICSHHDVIRDEINPIPFYFKGKNGILFESLERGRHLIKWVDLNNKNEKIMVNMPGENILQ